MNPLIKYGLIAASGVALDVAQGFRALGRYGQMALAQVEQDRAALATTGRLAVVAAPPPPPGRPRNLLAATVVPMLATGAGCGLIVGVLIAAVNTAGGGNTGQGVIAAVFLGIATAVVTTLLPGIFLGLFFQRREAGRRYAAEAHRLLMVFHGEREAIRHDLDSGLIDATEADRRLVALVSPGDDAAPPR